MVGLVSLGPPYNYIMKEQPLRLSKTSIWIGLLMAAITAQATAADTLLWQIGKADDKSDEFVDFKAASQQIEIPQGRSESAATASAGKGLHGVAHSQLQIAYHLNALPAHGVLFSFKLLDATKNGPQMAVFSNDLMAGLIQLSGTAETNSAYPWKKTYRLYIPRELLAAGRNVLTLKSCRPLWSDASVGPRLWWKWDYLRLEALAARRASRSTARWPIWARRSSTVPTTSSSTMIRCGWPRWRFRGWASPIAATRSAPISGTT